MGGLSQSRHDQSTLSPGSSRGGGGGGGGGRRSGASPSSVFDSFVKRLYFSSFLGVSFLMIVLCSADVVA